MEIVLIQDARAVDYKIYQEIIDNLKETLFKRGVDKETSERIYITRFVGILLDKNRIILSLPKSITIKDDIDKEALLYKYAKLFDLYLKANNKKHDSIEEICKKIIKENKTDNICQEIITFKFEMSDSKMIMS